VSSSGQRDRLIVDMPATCVGDGVGRVEKS